MSAPIVLMPWDDLSSAIGDPMRDAPVNASTGGVVYFDDRFEPRELATVLRFLGVSLESKGYAVFAAESSDPEGERYLAQIRIAFEQNLEIGALLAAFINAQRKRYGSNLTGAIAGSLGGDGDWASETLGFGFMAEYAKNGVYRLWSRP